MNFISSNAATLPLDGDESIKNSTKATAS